MNVLAVMTDLFFAVQVMNDAKKAGLTAQIVGDRAVALEKIREKPAIVVLDLNCAAADPIGLIQAIKGNPETSGITTVGFVSHVQVAVKQSAQEAGCDFVVARSAFAQKLPQIFQEYAERRP